MGVGLCEFESHHPHEKGSYLNDRWLPFFVLGPQTRTHTAPRGAVRRTPDWGFTWTARHWRASVRVSPSARKRKLSERQMASFFSICPSDSDSHRPEGISGTSREIHLGRSMPSGTPVSYAACLDEAISAASRQGNTNTTSYGEASLPG